ncbi:MAG: glycosyltransferase family 4 protein [Gammaproteobacteria bacterium]|nr:glycosyltransferase family 4 protein [Gammaproteobacteria bacterium]MBT8110535.1 glycosyltransferase family 4 protein [Gammaproteobacteria bacterium]NNL45235.1 glycosyltransferase family 4 protein [Woeseiaceae bacterium]
MIRQSILIVTRNYPPLTGGMERLMQHSVTTLASRFDVTLIGPTGCGEFAPAGVRTIECPPSPFSFLTLALLRGWRSIRSASFDAVVGGSGLVAPVTAFLSRVSKARSVVFVHGLDLVVDNRIYQHLFVPFLRRHDLLIANSQNTRRIATDKGCQASRISVLHPGSTIPPESLLQDAASIRVKLGFEKKKIVLFVGRMVRRKGLAEFLEKAWPRIVVRQPDAMLLIVGDSPDNALLQDPQGARRLMAAIERCAGDTVRFLGTVEDGMLWDCYAAADVLVFPLIRVRGDVEGFGMVAIEAAACGTPTVAFPVGGVVDAVVDGVNGTLVPEGRYEAFADAVLSICAGGPPGRTDCRNHALQFSWDVHGQKLLEAMDFAAAGSAQSP